MGLENQSRHAIRADARARAGRSPNSGSRAAIPFVASVPAIASVPSVPALATLAAAVLGVALFTGCGTVREVFRTTQSPYAEYVASLEDAGLADAVAVRDWLAAGESALASPVPASIPLREVAFFDPQRPQALGYRVGVRRGQALTVRAEVSASPPSRLFVDLFRERTGDAPERVAGGLIGPETTAEPQIFQYEPERDGELLLRVQPELLAGGRLDLRIEAQPVLGFPVAGRDARAIGGIFGDPRDGGGRSHEGLDIFAPHRTPAVAATDGVVSRVGTNTLGGNVVWLRDRSRGLSLYYAHLDEHAVTAGTRVSQGDTLGFIGTTGNARGTPPHLHFGVYAGSALDPSPFVVPHRGPARDLAVPEAIFESDRRRVAVARANLRAGPEPDATILDAVPRGTVLRLIGASGDRLRVALPDGAPGYIAAGLTEAAEVPLERLRTADGIRLRTHPRAGAAIDSVAAGETVERLGEFEGNALVRSPRGRVGWVPEIALTEG